MSIKSIPKEIKAQAEEIIAEFNRRTFRRDGIGYQARFRGRFLYLDRLQYGQVSQICRLTYTGDMKGWEFAIFKYSDESYDPDEWLFPGGEEVDGTIAGAMKAGMKAYPF
jgi:hypothetical protein